MTLTRTGYPGTQTITYDRDMDTNVETITTVTSPDFFWPGWALYTNVTPNATNRTKTYREYDLINEEYIYTYENFVLSNPFSFEDFCVLWKERCEEICPLADMREPVPITAIYSGSTETTLNLVLESEYNQLSQAAIDAANVRSRIYLRPTSTSPWDGKYIGNEFSGRIYSMNDRNTVPGAFGCIGVPGAFTSGDSLNAFARTCHAFENGFGCDAPDDFRFHDIPLQLFNLSTSLVTTPTYLGITLAPGYYSFDGERMIVHSGSRIAPSATNAWLDATGGDTHYGYMDALLSSGDDPCPP